MATGIPRKGIAPVNGKVVTLAYTGKSAPDEVLRSAHPQMRSLWRHPAHVGNRLYFGDNLQVLTALLHDSRARGHVRLVYIDPPFSTRSVFVSRRQDRAYQDTLIGADFIEFLRKRLIILRELLASDGSLYLHLDDKMVFHMKIILDEIFGGENYRRFITRKKCNPKNYTHKAYGNISDYVLFYTKTSRYVWNKPTEAWTEDRAKEYHYVEPETGRRYMKVPVHAPGARNGQTGQMWRGMSPPPGKHWQYPPAKLDELDARGEIYWSPNGNPRRKVYLDEAGGVGVQDIWLDFRDAHNQNIRITGYPTEKNADLLRRIVGASSNEGDLVLDCFSGSGTTLAVANELQRRWIGVDNSVEAIRTTLARFMTGMKPMGDFVQARRSSSKKEVSQQSLFGSLGHGSSEKREAQHKPIVEFEILAVDGSQDELRNVIREWNADCSDSSGADDTRRPNAEDRADEKALLWLSARDHILARLIQQFGTCTLEPRAPELTHLVDAVIAQQLSFAAARTISRRVKELFGTENISAEAFADMPATRLASAGMSRRKIETLNRIARLIAEGSLDLVSIGRMSDNAITNELIQIKGIGHWTVEMFLMFGLGRLNVLPIHDKALLHTIERVYGLEAISEDRLSIITDRWSPYRSVACWYLYKYRNAQGKTGLESSKQPVVCAGAELR